MTFKESSEKEISSVDIETATEPVNIITQAEKIDKADIIQECTLPVDAKEKPNAENKIQVEEQINDNKETVTTTADILEIFPTTYSTSPVPEFKQWVITPCTSLPGNRGKERKI